MSNQFEKSQEFKKVKNKFQSCLGCGRIRKPEKLHFCDMCHEKFCNLCLTEVEHNYFICDHCLIRFHKEKVLFVVTK